MTAWPTTWQSSKSPKVKACYLAPALALAPTSTPARMATSSLSRCHTGRFTRSSGNLRLADEIDDGSINSPHHHTAAAVAGFPEKAATLLHLRLSEENPQKNPLHDPL